MLELNYPTHGFVHCLMYLFREHVDQEDYLLESHQALLSTLANMGFSHKIARAAITWLDDLIQIVDESAMLSTQINKPWRHFDTMETHYLNDSCLNYLTELEQSGELNTGSHELVIERTLALPIEVVTLDILKWVVIIVLYQVGEKNDTPNHSIERLIGDFMFNECHPTESIH